MRKLPVLDISSLVDGSGVMGKAVVKDLDAALAGPGFLYVKNHGIDTGLQDELFVLARKFFSEPLEFKNRITMKNGGQAWRGFFPVGGELTSGRPDQKEGIYFGTELSGDHPSVIAGTPLHGPNLWPTGDKYKRFKPAVLSYMRSLTALGQTLMSAVAVGLGLDQNYFRARFTENPTTLFRIFNYPFHSWKDAEDEWGVREHTDMGFLTILLQDPSGGLQVKSGDQWIEAPPLPGTFVINIGDMLEVWTRGIYRATPHRVRNQGKGDRLSIPFFFDPAWSTTLEPIPERLLPAARLNTVVREDAKRWDGLNLRTLTEKTTYGDFVWNKVKNVFPNLAK